MEQKVLAECDNNVKIESSGINNGGQVKVEAILERLEEQLSGYNSGDEHLGQKETSVTSDEWKKVSLIGLEFITNLIIELKLL